MDLSLRQIRAFVSVAHLKSFTRARAIQFWLWDAKGQQPLEAEGIGVECLADILDTVGA
jgi:hypothetical protein